MERARQIIIESGGVLVRARIAHTPTADALWRLLPVSGEAKRWGDELYLRVPLEVAVEPGAHQVVEPGSLCFWCEGSAIAIPFGPTPISLGNECRLVAPVNVWGRLEGDARRLGRVRSGDVVLLRRCEP